MTGARAAIFAAFRAAKPDVFNNAPERIAELDALCDRFGIARDSVQHALDAEQGARAFFAQARKVTGALSREQVDNIKLLLAHMAHWRTSWAAYGLETAWHEARMIPQAEWGKGKGYKYGRAGKHGQAQYGRGFVQLTWDRNYEWADEALALGGALLRDFDLALKPDIAARIMVKGMERGAFTGLSLAHCLPQELGTLSQFVRARAIINGSDKAAPIARDALVWQQALQAGGWS